MDVSESLNMAREFAESKSITWDPKPKNDSVNFIRHKKFFSAEKGNTFNNISEYQFLPELQQKCADWMLEIFGHETPLYLGYICHYSPENNVNDLKKTGSLLMHVDGSSVTGDLCAVVYTFHYGQSPAV